MLKLLFQINTVLPATPSLKALLPIIVLMQHTK